MDEVNCQNYTHRDEFAVNELFNNVPLPFLSTSSLSAAAKTVMNNFPQLLSSSSRHNHYNIKIEYHPGKFIKWLHVHIPSQRLY